MFDVTHEDLKAARDDGQFGLVHSLLFHNVQSRSREHEEFVMREPLLLNGHSGSPITCLAFSGDGMNTNTNTTMNSTLASGSSDGTIILWDVINGKTTNSKFLLMEMRSTF